MLYLVHMDIHKPADIDPELWAVTAATEKARSLELQRAGIWKELWRVTGEYANYSVFEVADHDELHEILSHLPLFPYMSVHVTPLSTHPSHMSVNPL